MVDRTHRRLFLEMKEEKGDKELVLDKIWKLLLPALVSETAVKMWYSYGNIFLSLQQLLSSFPWAVHLKADPL